MLAGAATMIVSGCGILGSTYHYRYRMTVEVETPEGLKTGSAVYEQMVAKSDADLGELSAKRGIKTRGEAVAVDLPRGQVLFALIPDSEVAQAVLDPEWHNDWVKSARRITSGETPAEPLQMIPTKPAVRGAPPTGYPTLVRFRDINDPSTVEEVDPNNLGATFGAGAQLKQITLQLTTDSVTRGIEDRLSWLGNYINKSFTGKRFSNPYGPVTETLRAGNFSTEIE